MVIDHKKTVDRSNDDMIPKMKTILSKINNFTESKIKAKPISTDIVHSSGSIAGNCLLQ